jgi:Cu/Ag efflux protein CusF
MGTTVYAQQGESADEPMMPGERSTTVERGTTTPEENLRTVTVTVESVDPKQNKVTFQAAVQPEANITSDGQPIRLQQLQEGDQVRASFDPATGELVRAQVIKKEGSGQKQQ